MRNVPLVFLGILLILFFLTIGPWLLLWSVGTMLQGEGLDFTFWNWLAAVVFLFLMNGSRNSSN